MKKGFTLVELAIVLVIIGLVISGVFAGNSLVQQAKTRSIYIDGQKIKVAVNSFMGKYNYLPGDTRDGFAFWGATCAATADECNGDGNKKIDLSTSLTAAEQYRAWQHLTLEGLLPGNYTGVATNAYYNVPGRNVPSGALSKSAYSMYTSFYASEYNDTRLNLLLLFGLDNTTAHSNGKILKVKEAYRLDEKFDDSRPNTGDFRGGSNAPTSCATGSGVSWQYNLALSESVECHAAMVMY